VDVYAGARPAVQLGLLLLAGFLVRALFAVVLMPDSGYKSDLTLNADWVNRLVASGPGTFYQAGANYFNDYAPAYLYVLWALGEAGKILGLTDPGSLLKVPLILADVATAGAIYGIGRQIRGHRAGMFAAALFLFNPAVIFDSTIWGQNDSAGALFVVLSLYMLLRGRTEWASVLAVVAALVKFQFAFIVPIVAVVAIRRHVFGRSSDPAIEPKRDLFRVEMSLVAGFGTLAALCWPFGLAIYSAADKSHSLWARFLSASSTFPGVTENAFNLWMNPIAGNVGTNIPSGLTEGHVVDDTVAILSLGGIAITWQLVGNVLFLAVVAIALRAIARRDDGPTVLFAALLIAVAFFALPTRVHERYLYPALAVGAPLVVLGASHRRIYLALSAVVFLDLFWIYTLPNLRNGGFDRTAFLNATVFSAPGIYVISAATVIATMWLTWVAARIALGKTSLVAAPAVAGVSETAGTEAESAAGFGVEPAAESTSEPPLAEAAPPEAPAEPATPPTPRIPWLKRPAPPARPKSRLRGSRNVALLVIASFVAALVAARIAGTDGPWLWNLDMPKIDYPLASFFHDALMHGHLPLWNDQLGLGYPLYAEGQIGAFYPPNWFIYLLPPLEALDVTRVLHLTLAGTGAGLIALRLGSGRYGAILAAVAVVLSGGIVSKLEWTNFLVAYGWLPWVLLPLTRRNGPTRAGLVAAGTMWGIQALAGHPNLWLFTGIAAVTLMLATHPHWITLARVAGFGLLGGAIGAVQLLSTLMLTPLSVRVTGLNANDLFASSSTPLDPLSFAFANVFVQSSNGSWNLASTWYPNGPFALLETTAYVGLPILVLAAIAVTVRRARPFVAVGAVMAAIPIVAAFRPWFWSEVPILDALRSPVRTYVVVDVVIALLAAVGLARMGRQKGARLRIAVILAAMLGGYAFVVLLAERGSLADFIRPFSIFSSPIDSAARALPALTNPFPLVPEVLLGLATAGLAIRARPTTRTAARLAMLAALAWAIAPLAAFIPQANTAATRPSFISDASPFTQSLQAADAHRLLTVNRPGWYEGMPDQLATAGVPDMEMFSSLNLLASDQLLSQLQNGNNATALRQAVGIDTIVTFGQPCPGTLVTTIPSPQATVCRDPAATHPPYWFADSAVAVSGPGAAWPSTRPVDAMVDPAAAVASAVSAHVTRWDTMGASMTIDQPVAGWVWLDRAWYPSWRVTVDGQTVPTYRAMAGTLIRVPAGSHVIEESLMPFEVGAGLLAGIAAFAIAITWVLLRRRPSGGATGHGSSRFGRLPGRLRGPAADPAPPDSEPASPEPASG
jgi:Gpi18-like mannosyltransferase